MAGAVALSPAPAAAQPGEAGGDVAFFARRDSDGAMTLHAMVEGVHCGGCVAKIERGLGQHPAVVSARVNLSTRRLALRWRGAASLAEVFAAKVAALGFKLVPYDPARLATADKQAQTELLRALAVAGFAAANVMLMSVAIWAGNAEGMEPATRDMLHWFSGLVALPALIYAVRPFVRSAWRALKGGTVNMDVPIVVGVVLTAGMSLLETARGAPHAYYDSAISLVFFLLLGRYLDLRARGRARSAAERLLAMNARSVTVLDAGGVGHSIPAERVEPGALVLVAPGERIGIDGAVADGRSELDASLITGESVPAPVKPGDSVYAGAVNLGAALKIKARAAGENTLLAEILRLMEAAEQKKSRYVALADRVSRLYAPVVHLMALATFAGWWALGGATWQGALVNAIAVLIVTCPCALGLAVPAVQVIASGRLMRSGVLLKSGTALERLAVVDTVVFDKTGTLTLGKPVLANADAAPADALALAAGIARNSAHPLARALAQSAPDAAAVDGVREIPGSGLVLDTPAGEVRLGSRAWCGIADDETETAMELWLTRHAAAALRFAFADAPRADAADVVAALRRRGYDVKLISGDRAPAVAAVADALGIADRQAQVSPADKTAFLNRLAAQGRKVLMVGDGLNDAPSLAAADVSMAPASASDVGRLAADFVFIRPGLMAVARARETARAADIVVRQNFAIAIAYNCIAVPLAMAGAVTPLVAAIAMSASSVAVVANSLRLAIAGGRRAAPAAPRAAMGREATA
ncbi:MAG: cadmium-translocating P-type ATPase [Rhodospirillaceae bacterium]|nr:cadmium-translocating P-type ATPase [Rhodospirillaceae bacterium]